MIGNNTCNMWRRATCILHDCEDVQHVFYMIVKMCNMYSAWLWRRATCSLYDCEDVQPVVYMIVKTNNMYSSL